MHHQVIRAHSTSQVAVNYVYITRWQCSAGLLAAARPMAQITDDENAVDFGVEPTEAVEEVPKHVRRRRQSPKPQSTTRAAVPAAQVRLTLRVYQLSAGFHYNAT